MGRRESAREHGSWWIFSSHDLTQEGEERERSLV
jgi:hypothetical protein